jgi:cytochrome P450
MKASYTFENAAGAWPLIGHVVPLLRDPLRFLDSLPPYGDLVRIRIGPAEVTVVCDPELTREVLINDRVFDRGGLLYDRIQEVVGNGLATCPYNQHRRQRRLTRPAFHKDQIPKYAPAMAEAISAVTGSWHDGQVLDVQAEMLAITTRSLAETIFAGTLPPAVLDETLEDLNTVTAGMFRRMLIPAWLDRFPMPGRSRYYRARARLRRTIDRIIADYLAGDMADAGLLPILLAARDPLDASGSGNHSLSDTEITDQVFIFFIAGVETTAAGLAWALHLIAQHSEIQRRLQAEVDAVLGDRSATYDDADNLKLTRSIFAETIRLRPPVWILTRTTATDTELGGHAIRAGTTVVYSPYIIHHRRDLYGDPERFDPDRWDGERAAAQLRDAFVGFGAGARKCIGDVFATTEATLALATIAARWHLTPVSGHRVRPARSAASSPQGLRLRVTDRAGQPRLMEE